MWAEVRHHLDIVRGWYSGGQGMSVTELTAASVAFFVSCYHFAEHIRADPPAPQSARAQARSYANSNSSLKLAADITNTYKHSAVAGPAQPQPAVLRRRQGHPVERRAAHALRAQFSERARVRVRPQPPEPDLAPGKYRLGRKVEEKRRTTRPRSPWPGRSPHPESDQPPVEPNPGCSSAHACRVAWARAGPLLSLIVTNRDHGPAPFAAAATRRNRPGTSRQSQQRRKPEGERCSRA
jgi:hypothetical protein